ncbi:MAG: DUF177 domain-containing protein [Brevefilum sp.]|nr:DUF177 domain-containing protein [Brevefilum sp.]MDT8381134.1 DUF177 domain-containing protein [Brevefilum sp.]MDW7755598.1 DUF177 domain-containing protein [Brevefilum sp.]
MNNYTNPLRLNVGYMYNKPIGTSRDVPVEIETLDIEDLLVKDLQSIVRISRTSEGLLLQAEGEAQVQTACVLCLVDFYLPVKFDFEELYQFPSRHREETDLILPFDGYIDLRSLYREYLILAMPIKPICQPDCKGLCAVCGANLNETTCEHHPELKSLKGITKGAESA